ALGPCMASKQVLSEMLCIFTFLVLNFDIQFQSFSIFEAFTTSMYTLFSSRQYTSRSSTIPPCSLGRQLYWAFPTVNLEASFVVTRWIRSRAFSPFKI